VQDFAYNPPKLADDFVEVKISHCGICGSDIHTIDSGWGPSNYPVIVGHEIVGHVTAVGKDVKHLQLGDRVGIGAQCGACLKCDACTKGLDNHCPTPHYATTYNGKYPDGQVTQGGYADFKRCQGDFVFKLPDSISSAEAAPLLCAGATVFAPLQRHVTRADMQVGVIGVGGLGHLAVKFASKMFDGKLDVTAISHNDKKKDDALAMGAKHFLNTGDKEQLKAAAKSFDVLLCTANGKDQDYATWLTLLKFQGTFCMVGAPEVPMPIPVFPLLLGQLHVTGSLIGSIAEVKTMLEFADKHNVRPIIERLPMSQANEGIKRVREGKARYRVVLEN